jgi:hypothetical protein
MISQKAQRQRRSTPMAINPMKPLSAAKKPNATQRGQLGGSLSAWS